MRNRTFYNVQQAKNYLLDSIIRVNDYPVMIVGVEELNVLVFNPLGKINVAPSRIPMEHPSVNMEPVHLGWVNITLPFNRGNRIILVARQPSRTWKVGLSNVNIFYKPANIISTESLIQSCGLINTIQGRYPSFKQAIKSETPLAFSRSFAIDENKCLRYSLVDEPIGEVYKNTVQLNQHYYYLSELLGKEIGQSNAA